MKRASATVFMRAAIMQAFEPATFDSAAAIIHRHLRGRIADERIRDAGHSQEIPIPRQRMKQITPGAVSQIPDGFDQVLSAQERADPLAFLKACK